MTVNDSKNSNPKPDPFEKYEKRYSSKRYQGYRFWSIAFTIFFVFALLINIPMALMTGFLMRLIGDNALPYQQTIEHITNGISLVGALVFLIWLWRMYKNHVLDNKPD